MLNSLCPQWQVAPAIAVVTAASKNLPLPSLGTWSFDTVSCWTNDTQWTVLKCEAQHLSPALPSLLLFGWNTLASPLAWFWTLPPDDFCPPSLFQEPHEDRFASAASSDQMPLQSLWKSRVGRVRHYPYLGWGERGGMWAPRNYPQGARTTLPLCRGHEVGLEEKTWSAGQNVVEWKEQQTGFCRAAFSAPPPPPQLFLPSLSLQFLIYKRKGDGLMSRVFY